MENQSLTVRENQSMTVPEMQSHVTLIHNTMTTVMKEGIHFGKIPGCPKPTLLKPGAEVLNVLFKLAPHYEELDCMETEDLISYRIRCSLQTHSGMTIATGLGACNSRERKYKKQDPWDIQNTLYKMACKRALVASTLNGTAASDIFTQDIEDMPQEMFQSNDPDAPLCPNCNVYMKLSKYPSKKPGYKNYYCHCKHKTSIPINREPGEEG